ncbi:MAG: haloacid dehalogenase-like hydrolase [Proteobacteria bacterium]|nr:haloacid dehalogenase-like hydrolase [Pseudomonadota bacterium]
MKAELLPLCVDLDDTLVLGDTVFAAVRQLIREKPQLLPAFFLKFITGGRPAAKIFLAKLFPVDPAALRYREELLSYLCAEKQQGRKLYLVSAATQDTVDRIAAHLKLFDAAYGSSATHNLKGSNKAAFIAEKISPRFAYAGDSFADLAIWKKAEAAILCGGKARILQACLGREAAMVLPHRHPSSGASAARTEPRAR